MRILPSLFAILLLAGSTAATAADGYRAGKTPDDAASFAPFDVKWPTTFDNAVVDVSYLLESPAGKSGRITVKNGHLAYPDGRRFRIWGIGITNKGAVPSKDSASRIAANLARYGVNGVRLGPANAARTAQIVTARTAGRQAVADGNQSRAPLV